MFGAKHDIKYTYIVFKYSLNTIENFYLMFI